MSLKKSKNQNFELNRKLRLKTTWGSYHNSANILHQSFLKLYNNNELNVDNYTSLINYVNQLFNSGSRDINCKAYKIWKHDINYLLSVIKYMDSNKPINKRLLSNIKDVVIRIKNTSVKHL